jgi:hypothetical protein
MGEIWAVGEFVAMEFAILAEESFDRVPAVPVSLDGVEDGDSEFSWSSLVAVRLSGSCFFGFPHAEVALLMLLIRSAIRSSGTSMDRQVIDLNSLLAVNQKDYQDL